MTSPAHGLVVDASGLAWREQPPPRGKTELRLKESWPNVKQPVCCFWFRLFGLFLLVRVLRYIIEAGGFLASRMGMEVTYSETWHV